MSNQPDLNIPPTTDPIAQKAYDLVKATNAAIAQACKEAAMVRWMSIAEREAALLIDPEHWDILWSVSLGQPPRVAITRYKGH
ncbi:MULTISPECIES: hypothetical protein [unclassified Sphingopyxis]|uniref:hypothetical protein n=1 Tax=unclassified Sphingopyxis TaxID=2614943 RepID=UPI002863986D|nr:MULTISPECIES: hypothetical protein [unclassified Sphingopyxis]MDR7061205.1 hypothetical protein [Sphingopyxis sp. BE235]MDR7182064.1 hypothetical protein [Sphingopyxis sp. BE249]